MPPRNHVRRPSEKEHEDNSSLGSESDVSAAAGRREKFKISDEPPPTARPAAVAGTAEVKNATRTGGSAAQARVNLDGSNEKLENSTEQLSSAQSGRREQTSGIIKNNELFCNSSYKTESLTTKQGYTFYSAESNKSFFPEHQQPVTFVQTCGIMDRSMCSLVGQSPTVVPSSAVFEPSSFSNHFIKHSNFLTPTPPTEQIYPKFPASQPTIFFVQSFVPPAYNFDCNSGAVVYQSEVVHHPDTYPGIQYLAPSMGDVNGLIQPAAAVPIMVPNSHAIQYVDCLNGYTYVAPVACVLGSPEVVSEKRSSVVPAYETHNRSAGKQIEETFYCVQGQSSGGSFSPSLSEETGECDLREVWHQTFSDLFKEFPNQWSLVPCPHSIPTSPCLKMIKDSAKVRFMCQECDNAWTSMRGCVVFWVQLDPVTGSGEVIFRLFGQQCQRCETKNFQYSMWYPEEVKKVLKNLHQRVGHLYYGFPRVALDGCRRRGKPRSPHNSSLCQACFNGVCTETA